MKRASKDDLLKFKRALNTTEHLKVEKEVVATTLDKPVLNNLDLDNIVVTKATLKEKLSVEEQIDYLKYKGITFNHYSDHFAKDVLANRTYYYKVTAFRKNFNKSEDNKYSNVDFSLLNDLAVIDMHLRYLFIKLSLDIEHSIKTLIIRLITESDEDGYEIIEEYKAFELESYRGKLKKQNLREQEIEERLVYYKTIDKKLIVEYKSPRDYSYDLWNKRREKPSIWVLIELMSYGQLCFFIKFYTVRKKYKYRELNLANSLLFDSKNIRDSSAHSRPIIFNVIGPNQFLMSDDKHIKLQLKNYLTQECNINIGVTNIRLRNLKIHDISALIYLHDYYVRGKITRTKKRINEYS